MSGTDEELEEEIRKWMKKLDDRLAEAKANSEKGVEYLTNIRAYQEDAVHFYEEGDKVRSFEALIWAWAYLTISRDLELISLPRHRAQQ